jgi:hypothetical protein
MIDWLEVARRELAAFADSEEVPAVLAVGGGASFEKIREAQAEVSAVLAVGGIGSFRKSEEVQPRGRAVHDVEPPFGVSGQTSPLGNDEKIKEVPWGSVKLPKPPFRQFCQLVRGGILKECGEMAVRKPSIGPSISPQG